MRLRCKRMRRPVLGVLVLLVLLALPARAEAAVDKRLIVGGFNTPVQVVFPPGARGLFVVEQPGRIIRYVNGRKNVFLDIRGIVRFGGEQGHEIVAESRDPRTGDEFMLVQWLRFGTSGFVQMFGTARKDQWATVLPRMRTLRDGFAPR